MAGNDAKLKADLQQLEAVVSGQGNRTMTLTEEVRQAITEAVGAQSGQAHNDQINARLGALDTKIEQTIGKFFQAIQEIRADQMHLQLAELQSSMNSMGDGIQKRFEAIEGRVHAQE